MKITPAQVARLQFLVRVTDKECRHLLDTDHRLFGQLFTLDIARNSALQSGHAHVPVLVEAARCCVAQARRLLSVHP